MNEIGVQIAKDNSKIYNAENINNYIVDNPLKFFCDKKLLETSKLEPHVQVMYYLVNNEMLKMRFGGSHYKYEYLVDLLSRLIDKQIAISEETLDDGYKSISSCIVKLCSIFILQVENNSAFLEVKDCYGLKAKIENMGLTLEYTDSVDSYDKFVQAKEMADCLIRELGPFVNCASQYGNFLQFNNITLNENIDNVGFIPKEIKFKVSNNIIPNLIKPLYGNNPECGLREIIQNACDACKEFKHDEKGNFLKVESSDPLVQLRIEYSENKTELIVRDFGIGMDENVLLNDYFLIGESSKAQSVLDLVGQFGIGVLAAFLLGDKIRVRTKSYKSDTVLSFEYDLAQQKGENINVIKKNDVKFNIGTEVVVELHRELAKMDINSLEKKLKINDWYVMPDMKIEYYLNGEERELFTLKGEEFKWKRIIESEKLIVEYMIEGNEEYSGPNIIYNGIAIPEGYKFKCRHISKIPCISIKSFDNSIKLNLERSKIEIGLENIVAAVEEDIIKISMDELLSNKNLIIDELGNIKRNYYSGEYISSLPLFFCKGGMGIFSQPTINNLNSNTGNAYKELVYVYGHNEYKRLNYNDLHENSIYLFNNSSLSRKELSDIIEDSSHVHLPVSFIKPYFYDANSQYNGFREKTMIKLYSTFRKELPKYNSVSEFWVEHEKTKMEFSEDLNQDAFIEIGGVRESTEVLKGLSNSVIRSLELRSYYSDISDNNVDVGIIR